MPMLGSWDCSFQLVIVMRLGCPLSSPWLWQVARVNNVPGSLVWEADGCSPILALSQMPQKELVEQINGNRVFCSRKHLSR